MTAPRWLDWNFYPGSACEEFIYQLQGEGVSSDVWRGAYMGDHLLPDWDHVKDAAALNPDHSCEVKEVRPWFTDLLGDWAKKFLLFYEGGKLHFDIDNGTGEKRMDLSVDVDWQAFCNLLNDRGVARDIGNFDPSPLLDEMFDDDCSLSWDDGKITVKFKSDKSDIVCTPSEFVGKAVDATADRFRREFGKWVWIYQKSDGWMKNVSWDEFNALLKNTNAAHTTEVQANHLQKSYGEHEDFYQTEVKIAFEDGSALYGAASGTDENDPFIKSALGYKGKWCDEYTFVLPVPLLACYLWY